VTDRYGTNRFATARAGRVRAPTQKNHRTNSVFPDHRRKKRVDARTYRVGCGTMRCRLETHLLRFFKVGLAPHIRMVRRRPRTNGEFKRATFQARDATPARGNPREPTRRHRIADARVSARTKRPENESLTTQHEKAGHKGPCGTKTKPMHRRGQKNLCERWDLGVPTRNKFRLKTLLEINQRWLSMLWDNKEHWAG